MTKILMVLHDLTEKVVDAIMGRIVHFLIGDWGKWS